MSMVQKLDYTLARRRCPRDFITCESTLDLDPLVEIIGQERAVKALQFGLDIKEEGFNIYVAGMAGTGKKTAIMTFLEQRAKGMPPPPDWCYVYNFEEEDKPNALRLPTGMGVQFRDDVAKYVEDLKKALTAAFGRDDQRAADRHTAPERQGRDTSAAQEAAGRAQERVPAVQGHRQGDRSQCGVFQQGGGRVRHGTPHAEA